MRCFYEAHEWSGALYAYERSLEDSYSHRMHHVCCHCQNFLWPAAQPGAVGTKAAPSKQWFTRATASCSKVCFDLNVAWDSYIPTAVIGFLQAASRYSTFDLPACLAPQGLWLPTCTAPTGDYVASHAMSPASSMAGSIHVGGMQQVMEQQCHALQIMPLARMWWPACYAPVEGRMIVTSHLIKRRFTCRSVTQKRLTSSILTTNNALNVRQIKTIVGMQKTLLPHCFHMIRSLRLDVPLHDQ